MYPVCFSRSRCSLSWLEGVELWICPIWPQNWKTGTRKFWNSRVHYIIVQNDVLSDVSRKTFADSVCLALNLYLKPKGVNFKCLVWFLDSKSVCLWYLVVLGLKESWRVEEEMMKGAVKVLLEIFKTYRSLRVVIVVSLRQTISCKPHSLAQ